MGIKEEVISVSEQYNLYTKSTFMLTFMSDIDIFNWVNNIFDDCEFLSHEEINEKYKTNLTKKECIKLKIKMLDFLERYSYINGENV